MAVSTALSSSKARGLPVLRDEAGFSAGLVCFIVIIKKHLTPFVKLLRLMFFSDH
ncbi:hypothetical protein [Robbsia andropogonis]|uniref:hypothetical protein n=1 Tax=Robbsia andropogonis TaxID=28092 RepID=UPI0004B3742A|nr:hypothetical protein [Robbsia andropogonis]MCP1117207.1 hypothetical protein [Robbsia andropogonis]MCP1128553.1 hypothetical protein [Robbsia andropogonis]